MCKVTIPMNTYSLVHTHAHTFRIIAEVARKIMEAVLVRGTFLGNEFDF